MARSFKIFGIKDGGSEEWVDTVSSPKAGKAAHEAMKTEGARQPQNDLLDNKCFSTKSVSFSFGDCF